MAPKIDDNHPLYLTTVSILLLYLTISDVPRAVQIGIQLTGMENYSSWSRAMQLNLLMKNKLGFIDGSITRDDFNDESEKL